VVKTAAVGRFTTYPKLKYTTWPVRRLGEPGTRLRGREEEEELAEAESKRERGVEEGSQFSSGLFERGPGGRFRLTHGKKKQRASVAEGEKVDVKDRRKERKAVVGWRFEE